MKEHWINGKWRRTGLGSIPVINPATGEPFDNVTRGSAEEVAAVLKLANQEQFAVIPRGAGSGFTGGSLAVLGGVVLVTSRLNRIIEINTDNLTAIVDHNKFQSTGPVGIKLNMLSLGEKFKAFGWETKEIDGNNLYEVVDALDWAPTVKGKPQAIIAHTIKGKGFPSLENTNCHFIKITDDLLQKGLAALAD